MLLTLHDFPHHGELKDRLFLTTDYLQVVVCDTQYGVWVYCHSVSQSTNSPVLHSKSITQCQIKQLNLVLLGYFVYLASDWIRIQLTFHWLIPYINMAVDHQCV